MGLCPRPTIMFSFSNFPSISGPAPSSPLHRCPVNVRALTSPRPSLCSSFPYLTDIALPHHDYHHDQSPPPPQPHRSLTRCQASGEFGAWRVCRVYLLTSPVQRCDYKQTDSQLPASRPSQETSPSPCPARPHAAPPQHTRLLPPQDTPHGPLAVPQGIYYPVCPKDPSHVPLYPKDPPQGPLAVPQEIYHPVCSKDPPDVPLSCTSQQASN